ncbi:MAG: GIY-YIG nuclease family protein [Candidatus Paceibacterota bacterium]|jgi:excinuclease ABC subunit C
MNSQYIKNNILPENPGVYLFKKGKGILYIGKATSLKDRVKSYFSSDLIAMRSPLIVDMVFLADKIDYIETDSVLEAIILEAELIKKHQPKYNTKEKDNKSFNYVVITKEDYPRVLVERGRNLENIEKLEYSIKEKFGPYTNGSQLKEAIKIVRKIFPFRDKCKIGQDKPCFNYQIGLCPGVCVGLVTKKEYQKTIKNIKLFFEGRKKQIIKNLEKEMNIFAKNQQFEKANNIKKTIFALNHIQDVALIKDEYRMSNIEYNEENVFNFPRQVSIKSASSPHLFRIEAYDVAHLSGTNNVGVMTVIENGEINKNEYRKFIIRNSKGSDTDALREILERRFKHLEWAFPQIIVVDGGKAQINVARKVLNEMKKGLSLNPQKGETLVSEVSKIEIVSVLKDEYHKPKAILGSKNITEKYSNDILLANSEAHRFAIKYHREKRSIFTK